LVLFFEVYLPLFDTFSGFFHPTVPLSNYLLFGLAFFLEFGLPLFLKLFLFSLDFLVFHFQDLVGTVVNAHLSLGAVFVCVERCIWLNRLGITEHLIRPHLLFFGVRPQLVVYQAVGGRLVLRQRRSGLS